MPRTTITLPDELLRRSKILAAERGMSMAEFIRQAIEEKAEAGRHASRGRRLAEPAAPAYPAGEVSTMEQWPRGLPYREPEDRPAELRPGTPRSLGIGASGHKDTSEQAADWPYEPRTWRSS